MGGSVINDYQPAQQPKPAPAYSPAVPEDAPPSQDIVELPEVKITRDVQANRPLNENYSDYPDDNIASDDDYDVTPMPARSQFGVVERPPTPARVTRKSKIIKQVSIGDSFPSFNYKAILGGVAAIGLVFVLGSSGNSSGSARAPAKHFEYY